jgi:hypothetical protein
MSFHKLIEDPEYDEDGILPVDPEGDELEDEIEDYYGA